MSAREKHIEGIYRILVAFILIGGPLLLYYISSSAPPPHPTQNTAPSTTPTPTNSVSHGGNIINLDSSNNNDIYINQGIHTEDNSVTNNYFDSNQNSEKVDKTEIPTKEKIKKPYKIALNENMRGGSLYLDDDDNEFLGILSGNMNNVSIPVLEGTKRLRLKKDDSEWVQSINFDSDEDIIPFSSKNKVK